MKLIFASLMSLLLFIGSSSALSSGAGRCVVGEPAPRGNHADPAGGTDQSLADGGYTITVDGTEVTDTVSVDADTPFEIKLSGPTFRGFLIMLAGQDPSAIEDFGTLGRQADGGGCAGTASATHVSAADKTEVTVTGSLSASTTMEVNVVVQNSGGVSDYYYTQLTVEVAGGAAAGDQPTMSPVMPTSPIEDGTEVCGEGFIMDNFCIDLGVLFDNRSVVTLEQPEMHSYHCLLDVENCHTSFYTMLGEPAEGQSLYTVDYEFDAASSAQLRALGQSKGKKGFCTSCTADEGPERGFRAGFKGTVVDGSANPPLVTITAVEATDGTEGYCDASEPEDGPTLAPVVADAPSDGVWVGFKLPVMMVAVLVGALAL